MSYPSNPGQPQYGPSGYQPPPQPDVAAAEHHRRRRKKRITAGAILGTAASIATILTLFITLDQQPQQNVPNNNIGQNTPATAYPVNVQSNFLNSCEANGPQNVCQCSLNWFEQHVSLSQFEQDETEIGQGGSPVDITNVTQACG